VYIRRSVGVVQYIGNVARHAADLLFIYKVLDLRLSFRSETSPDRTHQLPAAVRLLFSIRRVTVFVLLRPSFFVL